MDFSKKIQVNIPGRKRQANVGKKSLARTAASSAFVLSIIRSRSNPARTAKKPKIILQLSVVASI